jgi:hypothetical protein
MNNNTDNQIDSGYETPTDSTTEWRRIKCPPAPKKTKNNTVFTAESLQEIIISNITFLEQDIN